MPVPPSGRVLTPHAPLDEVAAALDTLVVLLQGRGAALADEIASVPAWMRPSARNLAHYLALRSVDLRPLQERLSELGLSSLGRAECDVAGSLATLRAVVARLMGEPSELPAIDLAEARQRLALHVTALLGPAPSDRPARVMVTRGRCGHGNGEFHPGIVVRCRLGGPQSVMKDPVTLCFLIDGTPRPK